MDLRSKILDMAMNLNRIGNWAADDYSAKKKRILLFLAQTSAAIDSLNKKVGEPKIKKTFNRFLKEFEKLKKEGKNGPKDKLYWAEQMMTWGNILTHRSQLLEK